jgi:hypothetical protein
VRFYALFVRKNFFHTNFGGYCPENFFFPPPRSPTFLGKIRKKIGKNMENNLEKLEKIWKKLQKYGTVVILDRK